MIINNLRAERSDDHISMKATITWEESIRQSEDYYFRIPLHFQNACGHFPDAFLTASLIPALSNGEKRILIDEPVCASLYDNLSEAIFWIMTWYKNKYENLTPPKIEARLAHKQTIETEGSCLFMSGGVDSTFSLCHNAQTFPIDHPGRIRNALFINGFDIGGRRNHESFSQSHDAYENAIHSTAKICHELGGTLLAIDTNIRHLDDTPGFWGQEFYGAALASCAHAVGAISRIAYLSSDGEQLNNTLLPIPYGSHPCLTPCYSSYGVSLRHYLSHYTSRLKRLAVISRFPNILDNIRVCFFPPADKLNCGRCEKCIRTMLALKALQRLDDCKAFSTQLTPQLVNEISIDSDVAASMYLELLEPLQKLHHDDYVTAIKMRLVAYEEYRAYKEETNWKGRIKRFDRRYLQGILSRLFQ